MCSREQNLVKLVQSINKLIKSCCSAFMLSCARMPDVWECNREPNHFNNRQAQVFQND